MTGQTIVSARRAAEIEKYARCYQDRAYRMGVPRRMDAIRALRDLPTRGTYLDVACGRGEMLVEARELGFDQTRGTEVVPKLLHPPEVTYAEAHALPFEASSFSVVTMFDVIEHLLPGDDERACKELARVAHRHVLITASNLESRHGDDDLHINRRPYAEWDMLFRAWFPGMVMMLEVENRVSKLWRVDL